MSEKLDRGHTREDDERRYATMSRSNIEALLVHYTKIQKKACLSGDAAMVADATSFMGILQKVLGEKKKPWLKTALSRLTRRKSTLNKTTSEKFSDSDSY